MGAKKLLRHELCRRKIERQRCEAFYTGMHCSGKGRGGNEFIERWTMDQGIVRMLMVGAGMMGVAMLPGFR